MKVDPKALPPTSPSSGAARAVGDGFRMLMAGKAGAARGPAAPSAVGAAAPLAGLSGLLALQGMLDADARARALRKGRRLLDALDRLQVALLGEGPRAGHVAMLQNALAEKREPSGDAGLDDVLNWAEVRAAVEAAKLTRSQDAT